jgi:bifunctional DNA-binding transcriptional regulator/antitoxin component of YhaV-PrlF toxin-antitoxin module
MPKPRPRPYGPAFMGETGQMTLPKPLREELAIQKGQRVTFYWWPGEARVLAYFGDDPTDEAYERVSSE